MDLVQEAAGLHASGKQRSIGAFPAGTFYKGADFKIELIAYFFCHWFHFYIMIIATITVDGFRNSKEAVPYHRPALYTS